ncbi:MAG: hypothetical protein OCD76_10825 [Reichenbachiella sp.]
MKQIFLIILLMTTFLVAQEYKPLFKVKSEILLLTNQSIARVSEKGRNSLHNDIIRLKRLKEYFQSNGESHKEYYHNAPHAKDARRLFKDLFHIVKIPNISGARVISNENIFSALVECLVLIELPAKSYMTPLKRIILKELGEYGIISLKKKYAKRIADMSPGVTFEKRIKFGLHLTQSEKKMILKKPKKYHDQIRALAGDKLAEKRIINSFKNSNDYTIVKKMTRNLIAINSKQTIKELYKRINDPLVYKSKNNKEHIRLYIILALGKVYPDEPLFHNVFEIQKHYGKLYSEHKKIFNKLTTQSALIQYMKDLEVWGWRNLGVKPNVTFESEPFIRKVDAL